jgi:hypothetical protein
MRNGILRDVIFAGAGVSMVLAVIGLPGQAAAGHLQWRIDQSQCQMINSPGQDAQLLPCYMPNQRYMPDQPPQAPARDFPKPAPPTP